MAKPETASFGKFRVLLGNDATPIVYAAPCGFTQKGLTLNKALNETAIPDCDDEDAPITLGRDVQSISASVTGQGVLAAAAVPVWLAAYNSVESVPVKIEVEFSSGTQTFTGKFHIESLEFGAEQGGRVTINVSMQSDGELTQTDDF